MHKSCQFQERLCVLLFQAFIKVSYTHSIFPGIVELFSVEWHSEEIIEPSILKISLKSISLFLFKQRPFFSP
jgi:hypothetical protein